MKRTYIFEPIVRKMKVDENLYSEGERLFSARGCAFCHGPDAGGRVVMDNPVFGTLAGLNLTTGIGGVGDKWERNGILLAIRHGLKKNGVPLKWMPARIYQNLAAAEVSALVTFIMSAPPVDRNVGASKYGPLAQVLVAVGSYPIDAEEIDHSAWPIDSTETLTDAEFGKYLARPCTLCHGENLEGGSLRSLPRGFSSAPSIRPLTLPKEIFNSILNGLPGADHGFHSIPENQAGFNRMSDREMQVLYQYLLAI